MLSGRQKQVLAMLAREAWGVCRARGDTRTMEVFRHEEVERACGKRGLRCCENRDYASVVAHLEDLKGNAGAALEWHVRAQTDPHRQAEVVLLGLLEEYGLGKFYVERICQGLFKCAVLEASTEQLLDLIKIVKARGRKRRELERENLTAETR